jgi:hypothetical protein
MTRLQDLKPDALVTALLKGLVGKEAVRLIRALRFGDPEARAIGPNRRGRF